MKHASSGFSLLELLGVTAIIGLLIGMVGSAAYSARQRAYTATANAECNQIAQALKSYFTANRKWPSISGSSEDGFILLSKDNLKPLLEGSEVYLDIPPDRFEDLGNGEFFTDPWGHPYRIKIEDIDELEADNAYEGAVAFPARFRYYLEEGVYDKGFSMEDLEGRE